MHTPNETSAPKESLKRKRATHAETELVFEAHVVDPDNIKKPRLMPINLDEKIEREKELHRERQRRYRAKNKLIEQQRMPATIQTQTVIEPKSKGRKNNQKDRIYDEMTFDFKLKQPSQRGLMSQINLNDNNMHPYSYSVHAAPTVQQPVIITQFNPAGFFTKPPQNMVDTPKASPNNFPKT